MLQADIWALHECDRIHAAIGQELIKAEDPKSEYSGRGTFGVFCALAVCSGGSQRRQVSSCRCIFISPNERVFQTPLNPRRIYVCYVRTKTEV